MSPNRETCFGVARLRERQTMELLAKVAAGRYASYLVRGRVEDPEDNLGRVARFCMERLEGAPALAGCFRDPVQARWGAPWHLDVAKLRTEVRLHLTKLQRETCRH